MVDYIRLSLNVKNYKTPPKYGVRIIPKNENKGSAIHSFEVTNPNCPKSNKMRVTYYEKNNSLIIKNSLRKWYYGKYTTKDLDIKNLKRALKLLATVLDIKYKDIKNAQINEFEFGKNLFLPPRTHIDYGNVFYNGIKEKWFATHSSIYLINDIYTIKLYDKLEEIKSKFNGKRESNKDYEEVINNAKQNFILRYELHFDRPNRIKAPVNKIITLNDLLKEYKNLLRFWLQEFGRLTFAGNLKQTFKSDLEIRAYLISLGIQYMGYKEYQRLSSKTPSDKRDAIRLMHIRNQNLKDYKRYLLSSSAKRLIGIEVVKKYKNERALIQKS